MAATTEMRADTVLVHTCDHRGTSQPAGALCRCSVCGETWPAKAQPAPFVWFEPPGVPPYVRGSLEDSESKGVPSDDPT